MADLDFQLASLKQKQSLPLEGKVILAQQRIREWYDHWDGQVYVSFSGGKDSTVLLHLVRELYPDVPAVFVDTGLEYPEIRNFAASQPDVTVVRPEMRFDQVIDNYGYPVASKSISNCVRYAKADIAKGNMESTRVRRLQGRMKNRDGVNPSMFNCAKWGFLLDAPFDVSEMCCQIMKKNPLKAYERDTGRKPYIGTMASESISRRKNYLQNGCNAFNAKQPSSQPLSIWSEGDVWEYIRSCNLPYSSIYDMGYERTGCMFCMFGCHLEKAPNRFQRMKETHPRQYDYCMRPKEEKGLGLRNVLEYIGVDYE